MVKVPVVSSTRELVGEMDVPEVVIAGPPADHLLYEAAKMQMANRRRGTAATKTRGEVKGSGAKPWRQKGIGRARSGSVRSPLWRGGGTVFGPQPREYRYRLPRSARRRALCAALAAKHREGRLVVVEGFSLPEPRTRHVVSLLHGLGLEGSALLIVEGRQPEIERAARNLPRVKVLRSEGLNVYDVLRHEHLVCTRAALEQISRRLQGAPAGEVAAR